MFCPSIPRWICTICNPAEFSLQEPVSGRGTVRNTAGVLVLEAVISTNLHAVCDRCAAPFERRVSWPVHAVLTRSLEREDEGR